MNNIFGKIVLALLLVAVVVIILKWVRINQIKKTSEYKYTVSIIKNKVHNGQSTFLPYEYFFYGKKYVNKVTFKKKYSNLKTGYKILTKIFIEDLEITEILPKYKLANSFDLHEIPYNGWDSIPQSLILKKPNSRSGLPSDQI